MKQRFPLPTHPLRMITLDEATAHGVTVSEHRLNLPVARRESYVFQRLNGSLPTDVGDWTLLRHEHENADLPE